MPCSNRCAVVLLAACAWSRVDAQTAPQLSSALYDSVAHASLDELNSLRISSQQAPPHSDAFQIVRSSLIEAREGELTHNRGAIDDAVLKLGQLISKEPKNSAAWFGVGYAKAELMRARFPASNDRFQPIGSSNAQAAAHALARAITFDSSNAPAKRVLADLLDQDDGLADPPTVLMWSRLAARGGGCGREQVVQARIERLYGDADSAKAAALRFAGCGDPDVAAFELSKSLFVKGDISEAIAAYFRGAGSRSDEAWELYRSDLALIASPEELTKIDAAKSPDARASEIRQFWLRRDVAAARSPGERLTEHRRRLEYVLKHFRYVGQTRVHEPIFVVRDTLAAFDDRGIVYLRHGEPTMTASDPSLDIPNVSWLYREPDGNLIFHFRTGPDASVVGGANYHLVESIVDILGFRNALQVRAGQPDSVAVLPLARQLFQTRSGLDPRYDLLASNRVAAAAVQLERERGREMVTRGLSTDTYPLRFDRSLEPVFLAYGLAGPTGGVLLVTFALPVARLHPLEASLPEGRVAFRVAFRVVALGPSGSLLQLDTVRTFAVAGDTRTGFISGTLELGAPAGEYHLSAVASQADGNGTAVDMPAAFVPDASGAGPTVSSLVAGKENGLAWASRNGNIELNPLNTFPNQGSTSLFYQIGGFDAARPLSVRVELSGSSGHPTALQFQEVAGPFRLVRKSLELEKLKPGKYHLTLSVQQSGSVPLLRGTDLYITEHASRNQK